MKIYTIRNCSGSTQEVPLPGFPRLRPWESVDVHEGMFQRTAVQNALARGTFNVVKEIEVLASPVTKPAPVGKVDGGVGKKGRSRKAKQAKE